MGSLAERRKKEKIDKGRTTNANLMEGVGSGALGFSKVELYIIP